MKRYVILLRGINVGGKNKIPMQDLKLCLEELEFENVVTYIQSGNVILRSSLDEKAVGEKIEAILTKKFKLDSEIIKALALEYKTYKKIVTDAPKKFGQDPTNFRDNVIFLMQVAPEEAMKQVSVREGVDEVWAGNRVLYFRNSIPNATKSHLNRITTQLFYKSITIRNWNTTVKLLELLEKHTP